MANYNNLLSTINGAIRTNGTGAITGQLLQTILDGMVASLGAKYQYAGVATPATNPGTPDENVFYLATQAGTYTNFGGLVVNDGEVCALKWDGTWAKDVTGAATAEQVSQLGQEIDLNKNKVLNKFPDVILEEYAVNIIISSNKYLSQNNYFGIFIPCVPNEIFNISILRTLNYAFVVGEPIVGESVVYAGGGSLQTATEDVLITAPSDATYLYVIYKVLGTQYPQSVIKDYSDQRFKEIELFQKDVERFLFDSTILNYPVTTQGYLDTNGVFHSDTSFRCSDYIEINEKDILYYKALNNATTPVVCFYDADKNFISAINGTGSLDELSISVDSYKKKYARISSYGSQNAPYAKIVRQVHISSLNLDNKIGRFEFVNKGYLGNNDGVFHPDNSFRSTDVIPVASGDILHYRTYQGTNVITVGLYDVNNNFVSQIDGTGAMSEHYIVIPDGIFYVRLSNYGANSNPFAILISKLGAFEYGLRTYNKFEGKKVLFIGDSITQNAKYVDAFVKRTKCIAYNRGLSGSVITKNNATAEPGIGVGMSMVERLDKPASEILVDGNGGFPTNPDVIFFLGGVNDWGRQDITNSPFGSLNADIDNETYCGAVRYMFKGLKAKYPDKPIFILLPLHLYGFKPATWPWSEVVFTDNDLNKSFVANTNGTGKTFYQYRDVQKECAELYGFYTIDLFKVFSAVIASDKTRYYQDGLHPNDLGGEIMAKYIYEESNKLLNP